MTTDTKEAEARARAHELLGEAICFAPRPDYHTSATCDRLTAALLAHSREVEGLEGEVERLRGVLRKIAEHSCDVAHAHQGLCAEAGLKSRCPSCRAGEALAK